MKLLALARLTLWTTPALLGLLLLAGCDDNYPRDLRYPLRDDPLVLDTFKVYTPKQFDPPGQLSFVVNYVLHPPTAEELSKLEPDRKNILQPTQLTGPQRDALSRALEDLFGTPAQPTVKLEDESLVGTLKLDNETLARGSHYYREHCLHCHGLSGNGRGPTASWVNPHPRDYRSGIFKFTSSGQQDKVRKARRADLLRTLREGIENTSMPSFGLQPENHLEAMASYVMHLSIRGQTEFMVMTKLVREPDTAAEAVAEEVKDTVAFVAKTWQQAETSLIKPPDFPKDMEASVQSGFKLFQKDGVGCIACHMDYGRQNNYLNDSWGTIVRAMDLTQGTYRGGRRPVDLFWRVHSGINGANMPAAASAFPRGPEQIWDVVNFLTVLPYPQMRSKYKIEIH